APRHDRERRTGREPNPRREARARPRRRAAHEPCAHGHRRSRRGHPLDRKARAEDRMITPEAAMQALFGYCRAENWAGYDPYDALNSPFLDPATGRAPKLVRLVATQLLKRSPLDLRGLLRVPKTQNAKGLALDIRSVHSLDE